MTFEKHLSDMRCLNLNCDTASMDSMFSILFLATLSVACPHHTNPNAIASYSLRFS